MTRPAQRIHGAPRLVAALAILASAPTSLLAQPAGGPPPARVVLDAARVERLEQRRAVTGDLRSARHATLAAETEGRLSELLVREGDAVEAGAVLARVDDTLARLDVRRREAEVKAAEADVAEAQADLEKAGRDLPRVRELLVRGEVVSQTVVDDAGTELHRTTARLARAEADLATARAELATAREQMRDATLTAPFAGRITVRHAEVGEWVKPGGAILELTTTTRLEAWLEVPERFLPALRRDGSVQLRFDAVDRVVTAPITATVPSADPLSHAVPVRVAVADPQEDLVPGMSVVGLVPSGVVEDTVTVHADAVRRDDAGQYVFFDAGGVAAVARIDVAFGHGDRVAIRSDGLPPGASVVVEGNERLFPGQPLAPVGGR